MTGCSYLTGDTIAHAFLITGDTLTDAGTLGGAVSLGYAITPAGQVVGEANLAGDAVTHAFLFSNGSMQDLGTLGGSYSVATAINTNGVVVGRSLVPGDADTEAFLYSGGQMTGLDSLGGGSSSAVAVNGSGWVAGDSFTAAWEYHSFLFATNTMIDLGTLGGTFSSAWALNESGWVVGESSLAGGNSHGFLYSDGAMHDLGTLGGTYSSAQALNERGDVIGISTLTNNATHGFIYTGGTMVDLGTLGGADSMATAINNAGTVVGNSTTLDGVLHAFVWSQGVLTDLNTSLPADSGWVLTSAEFINDAGMIVGSGYYNGVAAWFKISPTAANTPPTANAGPNQWAECGSAATLDGSLSSDPDADVLTYQWSSGGVVLSTAPMFSAVFPVGTNVVLLTVTDPCGASSQSAVLVTVADTLGPVFLTQPFSVTLNADAQCQAAAPDLLSRVSATDACDATGLTIAQDPAAGTLLGHGAHVITVTATDGYGNASTFAVPAEVLDVTGPALSEITAIPALISPPNGKMVPVTVTATATDNCDAAPVTRISSITANETVSPGDIVITGDLTASLAASRNTSGTDRIYTISLESTDASGNKSTASTTVTVTKSRGPKR